MIYLKCRGVPILLILISDKILSLILVIRLKNNSQFARACSKNSSMPHYLDTNCCTVQLNRLCYHKAIYKINSIIYNQDKYLKVIFFYNSRHLLGLKKFVSTEPTYLPATIELYLLFFRFLPKLNHQ